MSAAKGLRPAPWGTLETAKFFGGGDLRWRLHYLMNLHAMRGAAPFMQVAELLAPLIGVSPERLEVLYVLSLASHESEQEGIQIDRAEFEVSLYLMTRQFRAELAVQVLQRLQAATQRQRDEQHQAAREAALEAAQTSPTAH